VASFEFLATFDAFWAAHREMPEKSIDRSAPFSQQYARQVGLQHSLVGTIASFSLFTSATLIFGLGSNQNVQHSDALFKKYEEAQRWSIDGTRTERSSMTEYCATCLSDHFDSGTSMLNKPDGKSKQIKTRGQRSTLVVDSQL